MEDCREVLRRGVRYREAENDDVDDMKGWPTRKESYDKTEEDMQMEDVESDGELYFIEEKARRNVNRRTNLPLQRGGILRQYGEGRFVQRKRPAVFSFDDRQRGVPSNRIRRAVDEDFYDGTSYGRLDIQGFDDNFDEDLKEMLEDNEATPGGISYLSNVQTVVRAIRSLPLTDEQIEFLKKTPFWWFVKAALDMDSTEVYKQFRKSNFIITRLLKRFDRAGRTMGFRFGRIFMVPKRDDFVLIFGIKCGRRPVCPGGGTVKVTSFLQRCFPGKLEHMAAADGTHYKLTPTLLFDTLAVKVRGGEPDVGEDIGRLMHLFLLATFFMPNKGLSLPWRLTETIDNFEDMCEYDWSSFILEELMEDISKNRKLKIGACSIFLLFWFCERTFVMPPVRGCKLFPRFLKWDLFAMGKLLSKMDLDNLSRYTDFRQKLRPTAQEVELLSLPEDITEEDNNEEQRGRIPAHEKGKNKVADMFKRKHVNNESYSSNETLSFDDLIRNAPGDPSFNLMEDSDDGDTAVIRNSWKDDMNLGNKEVKWSNPLVKEVRLTSNRQGLIDSGRKLFPDENEEQLKASMSKIEDLQCELDKANATIDSLKKQLDAKETVKIALADDIISEEIEGLKAQLAESEKVRSRLSAFKHEDAKKIEKLCQERWQFRHSLEREKEANAALKESNERLTKLEAESNHRKFQLITENDRLGAELATALKLISDAGLKHEVKNIGPGDRVMSTHLVVEDKEKNTVQFADNESSGANKNDAIQTSGTPIGQQDSAKRFESPVGSVNVSQSLNSNTGAAGNSRGVSSGSGTRGSEGSSFATPSICKTLSGNEGDTSSDKLGTDSVDKPNSMVLRIQDRTKMNARKKTDLGTPIPISLVGPANNTDLSNEIRSMEVNRHGVAFRATLPYVISWLDEKFRVTRPCASILQLQNSQMANYITLANLEAILNNERIEDSVIDIWGLLISQKVAAENKARANRVFVARQIYLFHSFCWINVARFDVNGTYSSRVYQCIDKKLEDAINHDTWIFPICTPGALDPITNEGSHWSLLTYGVADGKWIFYNPLKPESAESDDHYLASKTLICYVEKKIKALAPKRRIPALRKEWKPQVIWYRFTPQQSPGTLDCGVVVCCMIESIFRKTLIVEKQWSVEYGQEQRAYMVNTLCAPVIAAEQEINTFNCPR